MIAYLQNLKNLKGIKSLLVVIIFNNCANPIQLIHLNIYY